MILFVDFSTTHNWRPNYHMISTLEQNGLDPEGLHPQTILIDGKTFDPAQHFGTWRDTHKRETARRRKRRLSCAPPTCGLRASVVIERLPKT